MPYPKELIRGISNQDFLDEAGTVQIDAFNFDNEREDYKEMSINWYDDEGALHQIFQQKKSESDEFQFKGGAAIIPSNKLKQLCISTTVNGDLCYERSQLPTNSYHGNILCTRSLNRKRVAMLRSGLALMVTRIEKRHES